MTVASLKIQIGADWSQARGVFRDVQSAVKPMADQLQSVGQSLSRSVTVPLAALGAASVHAAGEMESMELALKAVMGSAEEAERELDRLRKTAQNPGLGFGQAVQASLQLQNVGRSADQARELIAGLGNAIALGGGTADDFGEVNRQLTQIASLGKVTAENLNVILERSPAMAQALQQAFGTTSAEAIREMNLSTEEFFEGIQRGLAALPTAEGGILNDLSNAADDLRTALVPLGEAVADVVLPAVGKLTAAAAELGAWFEDLSPGMRRVVVVAGGLAAALGPVLVVAGALLSALPAVAAGLTLVKAAALTLGGGLGALLSPIGLVAAAVAALAVLAVRSGADFGVLRDAATDAWRLIVDAVGPAVAYLRAVVGDGLAQIEAWWSRHGAAVLSTVRALFGVLLRIVGTQMRLIAGAVGTVTQVIQGDWRGAWSTMGATARSVLAGVRGDLDATARTARRTATVVAGAMSKAEYDPATGTFRRPGAGSGSGPPVAPLPPVLPSGGGGGATSTARQVDEVGDALGRITGQLDTARTAATRFAEAGRLTPLQQAEGNLGALTAAMTSAADVAGSRGAAAFRSYAADVDAAALALARMRTAAADAAGPALAGRATQLGEGPGVVEVAKVEGAVEIMRRFREDLAAEAALVADLARDIGDALADAVQDGVVTVAEGIGGMLAGTATLGDLGRGLLGVVADLMGRLGKMLVAFGTAGLAFQASGGFFSFLTNPVAAIGAGALLIGAGAAIKGLLGSASRGATGGYGVRGVSVNPYSGATAGGTRASGATDRAVSAPPPTPVSLQLEGAVLPSGDLAFSLHEGGRRLDRYGTPLS